MNRSLSALFLVSSILLGVACTSDERPTGAEVVDRSAPVLCEKQKECQATLFEVAYPGGVSECTTRTSNTVKAQRKDLSAESVCTDDELTKCLNDLKAAACKKDGSIPDIPCRC